MKTQTIAIHKKSGQFLLIISTSKDKYECIRCERRFDKPSWLPKSHLRELTEKELDRFMSFLTRMDQQYRILTDAIMTTALEFARTSAKTSAKTSAETKAKKAVSI